MFKGTVLALLGLAGAQTIIPNNQIGGINTTGINTIGGGGRVISSSPFGTTNWNNLNTLSQQTNTIGSGYNRCLINQPQVCQQVIAIYNRFTNRVGWSIRNGNRFPWDPSLDNTARYLALHCGFVNSAQTGVVNNNLSIYNQGIIGGQNPCPKWYSNIDTDTNNGVPTNPQCRLVNNQVYCVSNTMFVNGRQAYCVNNTLNYSQNNFGTIGGQVGTNIIGNNQLASSNFINQFQRNCTCHFDMNHLQNIYTYRNVFCNNSDMHYDQQLCQFFATVVSVSC